jgi:BlaI family penicillinase repressor
MKKLSHQEQQAMHAIWTAGPGVINDFLRLLANPKPPYTTFASTVKKLEGKGLISGRKQGKAYCYTPAILENEYKQRFINGIVSEYFKNSYKELVTFFASENKISAAELEEVIKLTERH